jgi:membrane-associated protein
MAEAGHAAVALGPMLSAAPVLGALGVLLVVFAESGLLVVGFFLPGDTLLLPAGMLCAAGAPGDRPVLWQVLACAAGGAIAGAQAGFWLGRRGGRALLERPRLYRLRAGFERAEAMLARHGVARTIVVARFVPVVRTVASPLAGAAGVPARTFLLWQAVGSLAWSQSMVLAGYLLGAQAPGLEHDLVPLTLLVLVASPLPAALGAVRPRGGRPVNCRCPNPPARADRVAAKRRPAGPS